MTGLTYRVKDIEAAGTDVSMSLSRDFMEGTLVDLDADVDNSTARVSAHLSKQGVNVLCDGQLTGHLALSCQRCLGSARVDVDVALHTVFAPQSGELPGDESSAVDDPDDLDYAHHDGETVDLAPLLREYIILSVPMTVLCKEECRGLCPQCGGDRNTQLCSCRQEAPLSPFSALKNLKI